MKLGPVNSILSSISSGLPKSTSVVIELTISSTILKDEFNLILGDKGLSVLSNNSCFKGSLLYKTFIIGISISFPKFKEYSLK